MSTELIKVPFEEGEILCVKDEQGEHVVIKPMCERIGIDDRAQRARLQRASWAKGGSIMTLPSAGGPQQTYVLPRKRVAMWLATIDTERVREEVRPYLEALQERAADVLDAYFTGQPMPAARMPQSELETLRQRVEALERLTRPMKLKGEIRARQRELEDLETQGPTIREQIEILLGDRNLNFAAIKTDIHRRHSLIAQELRQMAREGLIEWVGHRRRGHWRLRRGQD